MRSPILHGRNVIQQGNLHDYFASDLIMEKNTEKPFSMRSNGQRSGQKPHNEVFANSYDKIIRKLGDDRQRTG